MSFTSIPHLKDPIMDQYYQELIINLIDFANYINNDPSNDFRANLYQENIRMIINTQNHFQHPRVYVLNFKVTYPYDFNYQIKLSIRPNKLNPKQRNNNEDHVKIRLQYEITSYNTNKIMMIINQIKNIIDQVIPDELYTLIEHRKITK